MRAEILQPYQPGPGQPWTRELAGHLLRRTGFGGTLEESEETLEAGPQKSLDRILGETGSGPLDRKDSLFLAAKDIKSLEASWLLRMATSKNSFPEKLALFWHGHFATSNTKVDQPRMMYTQYRLFREHGTGSFRDLLLKISADPAMIVWLDGNSNVRGHANENYARELMELFSLGIGNYTEADIQEAARAFTGWGVKEGEFHFNPKLHDPGEKTLFGKTGKFGGEDIVQLCTNRRASAAFLATKLYRFFVNPVVDETTTRALADAWEKTGGHTGNYLDLLLRSRLFFSPAAYRSQIKSPVEFGVGILRSARAKVNLKALSTSLAEMGQRLFHPPTVKGWDGGRAWINSATLLMRHNAANAILREGGRLESRFDPESLYDGNRGGEVEHACKVFLDGNLEPRSRTILEQYFARAAGDRSEALRGLTYLVLTLPEYQLN